MADWNGKWARRENEYYITLVYCLALSKFYKISAESDLFMIMTWSSCEDWIKCHF